MFPVGKAATDTAVITVITVTQTIQNLIALVEGFNLQQGIDTSLDVKLGNVIRALEAVNNNNRQGAEGLMNAFIVEVNAQRNHALTDEQADQLLNLASRILDVM